MKQIILLICSFLLFVCGPAIAELDVCNAVAEYININNVESNDYIEDDASIHNVNTNHDYSDCVYQQQYGEGRCDANEALQRLNADCCVLQDRASQCGILRIRNSVASDSDADYSLIILIIAVCILIPVLMPSVYGYIGRKGESLYLYVMCEKAPHGLDCSFACRDCNGGFPGCCDHFCIGDDAASGNFVGRQNCDFSAVSTDESALGVGNIILHDVFGKIKRRHRTR